MIQKLIDEAENAIELSLKDKTVVEGTDEPSEVARLVNALPDNLVRAWSDFVKKGAMTVSAAFCHAKPRVTWKSPLLNHPEPHEPELADLLLIIDVQGKTKRDRRALLIQVKKSKTKGKRCTLTKEGDLVQRHMYSDWPTFDILGTWQNAIKTPPKNVSISTPSPLKDLGTRYAVVRSIGTNHPGWSLELSTAAYSPPQPPIHSKFKSFGHVTLGTQQSLGTGLVDLYLGKIGRDCDASDDWSNLVSYLEAYVWEHTNSDDLPHVEVTAGATPSALTSATTYLATSNFVMYSGNTHVLGSQWMYPALFEPQGGGAAIYRWPGLNRPSTPSEIEFRPESGFGVIRVVIDYPLDVSASEDRDQK